MGCVVHLGEREGLDENRWLKAEWKQKEKEMGQE